MGLIIRMLTSSIRIAVALPADELPAVGDWSCGEDLRADRGAAGINSW